MIGCGGITETHLTAYKKAGYNVVAFCDLVPARAEKRRKEFCPRAKVYADAAELLARDEIEVVDIATHPRDRVPLIEAALRAKKHVLSQKPFALNLDVGERLADLADANGVKLAVNQNGRWAPHFSYLREAVRAGVIGDLMSAHVAVHWDHTWTAGTPFEEIHDMIFYDFAIHWFDFVSSLLGDRKRNRIQASRSRAIGQTIRPPMLAQAILEFDGGQASLVFDAHVKYGSLDRTYIAGTKGSLRSEGPNLREQTVRLYTADGYASPELKGNWFPDGFHGAMGELLCAIEEDRPPSNNARDNLNSLALCFAAIASATDGEAKKPGAVRRLPPGSAPGAEEA
jgi:predicted dehydrogenase